jgi:hypothetical protein
VRELEDIVETVADIVVGVVLRRSPAAYACGDAIDGEADSSATSSVLGVSDVRQGLTRELLAAGQIADVRSKGDGAALVDGATAVDQACVPVRGRLLKQSKHTPADLRCLRAMFRSSKMR